MHSISQIVLIPSTRRLRDKLRQGNLSIYCKRKYDGEDRGSHNTLSAISISAPTHLFQLNELFREECHFSPPPPHTILHRIDSKETTISPSSLRVLLSFRQHHTTHFSRSRDCKFPAVDLRIQQLVKVRYCTFLRRLHGHRFVTFFVHSFDDGHSPEWHVFGHRWPQSANCFGHRLPHELSFSCSSTDAVNHSLENT